MRAYHFDQDVIWHVVFHPGRCLWGRQWRHVSLAGFTNQTWLHLDLGRGGVSAAAFFAHDEVQDYLSYLLAYYGVLKFGPSRGGMGAYGRPMTCVSFVKHVLGVRSGALLPDGLWRDLVRNHHAEIVNAPEGTERDGGAAPAAHRGGARERSRDQVDHAGADLGLSPDDGSAGIDRDGAEAFRRPAGPVI